MLNNVLPKKDDKLWNFKKFCISLQKYKKIVLWHLLIQSIITILGKIVMKTHTSMVVANMNQSMVVVVINKKYKETYSK